MAAAAHALDAAVDAAEAAHNATCAANAADFLAVWMGHMTVPCIGTALDATQGGREASVCKLLEQYFAQKRDIRLHIRCIVVFKIATGYMNGQTG